VAGGGVYLLSFQPAPEVERVIGFAAAQGKRRFAALIPNDTFGAIVTASFKDAVSGANGTIVALETYPSSANGMLAPLRKISASIKAAEAQGEPVDALFIPGAEETLEPIARLLPQADIDLQKIKLIGTGGLDYPNAGRDASLVGAWYPAPDPQGWSEFSQKFAKAYGQAPPRIASLAYDAVSLAIALSKGSPGLRYDAANLTRSNGFTGIDGAFRLRADGRTERALAILEVQPNGAHVIEAAPGLSDAVTQGPATSAIPGSGSTVLNFN
jgi:ABC-type branched-subunit amino acid transport system substrate-binding protein